MKALEMTEKLGHQYRRGKKESKVAQTIGVVEACGDAGYYRVGWGT